QPGHRRRKRFITIQVILQRVAKANHVVCDVLGTVKNAPLCTGMLPRVAYLIRDLATVAPAGSVFIGPVSRMPDIEMASVGVLAPPVGQYFIRGRRMTKREINLWVDVINPAFFQPLQRVGIKLTIPAEAR